jgi:hypothetical protein
MAIVRALLVLVVLAAAGTAWIVSWHAREAREAFEAESAVLAGLAAGTPLDTSRYRLELPEVGFTGRLSRPAITHAQFARSLAAGRWRREPARTALLIDNNLIGGLFPPPRQQAVVTADGERFELTTYRGPGGQWTVLVQDGMVPMDTVAAPVGP